MPYADTLLRASPYDRVNILIREFERKGWQPIIDHPTVVEAPIPVKAGQKCYLVQGKREMVKVEEGRLLAIATGNLELWLYDPDTQILEKHKFVAVYGGGAKYIIYLVKKVDLSGKLFIVPSRAVELQF